jgi:beta-lactamase class A
VQGKALGPESTGYLLGLMARTATGPNRIKAGLEPGTRFAHKTGTQRRQVCDAGLLKSAKPDEDSRVIVVACARGEKSLARSENALRDVGNAICRSGLLNHGVVNAPSCDVAPRAERLSIDSSAAAEHPASHGR